MKRALSILFVLWTVSLSAQTIRLEFKPVAGAEYTAETVIGQNMDITVPAMGSMVTTSTQTLGVSMKLVEPVEKGYLMEAHITKFVAKSEAMGQSVNYSTEGDDPQSQAFKVLTTKPFRLIVSKLGEIVEMMPMDDTFYDGVDEVLATQYATRKRQELMTTIKAIINENTLKQVAQSGLTKFPDKELKIPSMWTDDQESPEMSSTVTTRYKLLSVEDGKVNLECQIVMVQSPNATPSDAAQRMENMSGSGSATLQLDAQTGWVIKGSSNQDVAGDYVVTQGGQSQTMAMKIKITTEINK